MYYFLLNDILDLLLSSLGTLVPQIPFCVITQQGVSLLRSNAGHGVLLVLWFNITYAQKQRHRGHTEGNRLNTHINIYYHHLFCAQIAAMCITLNE